MIKIEKVGDSTRALQVEASGIGDMRYVANGTNGAPKYRIVKVGCGEEMRELGLSAVLCVFVCACARVHVLVCVCMRELGLSAALCVFLCAHVRDFVCMQGVGRIICAKCEGLGVFVCKLGLLVVSHTYYIQMIENRHRGFWWLCFTS